MKLLKSEAIRYVNANYFIVKNTSSIVQILTFDAVSSQLTVKD